MRLSVLLLAAVAFSSPSLAQPPAPRQLFEAGQLEQALEAVAQQRQLGAANPADTYLAVQSLVKLGRPDQAKAELAQLEGSGDEIWKLIARSASALVDGNVGPALDAIEPKLPVKMIKLFNNPDSDFPNGVPNPMIEENRKPTIDAIKKHNADLGVAWDGDYDRCFFFDENGNFIEGY